MAVNRYASSLGIVLFASATPSVAAAQEAPLPIQEAQDSSGDIIVTAQKRSESVQKVAASITALGEETLQDRAVNSAAALAAQVPGLTLGEYGPTLQFAIRGISLDIKTGAGEPSVATHVDGVYLARPTMPLIDFEDVQRVEVLRGPQGTLYGRNSTGGAVNLISADPEKDLAGGMTFGTGSFNRYLVRGWVSAPLAAGKAALRLTGSYDENDGAGLNLLTGERLDGRKRYYGHAALALTPSDDLRIDLGGYFIRETSNGPGQYLIYQGPFFENAFPGVPVQFTTEPRRLFNEAGFDHYTKRQLALFTGRLAWDISDNLTLKSTTGVADSKFETQFSGDGASIPYVRVGDASYGRDLGNSRSVSQEFNVSGSLGGLDFVTGLYYFHERFQPRVPINYPIGLPGLIPPGGAFLAMADERTESYAAFADVTAHVTDRFRVVGGLRAGRDEKRYTQTFGLQLPGFPLGEGPGFVCAAATYKDGWTSFTPKAALQYDVSDSAMLYGQYQRGTKSGQFNLTVCNNKVAPEVVDAFEVGFKSRLIDRSLTLNVAVFRYDYKDLHVDRTIPGVPPTSILDNAATAKVDGFEVETVMLPSERVSVNLGVTYLNSRYGTYFPGTGEDFSGNRLSRAPRWTVKSGAEWRVPLKGFFSEISLRGELNLTSKIYFEPSNLDLLSQPSTVIGNAYLNLTSDEADVTLRAYVTNIGDVTAVTGGLLVLSSQNAVQGFYNQPRTFGIELSKRF